MYTKGRGPMCPRDGFVVFRNSELLCGRLGKQALGGGNKASLFQARGAALHRTRVAMCGRYVVHLFIQSSVLPIGGCRRTLCGGC